VVNGVAFSPDGQTLASGGNPAVERRRTQTDRRHPAQRGTVLRCHRIHRAAGPTIAVPFRGRRLSANQRAVNRSIAKARALGERAAAALKTWRT